MSLLFAMLSFSLAMSISPGPVNMLIVSSGVNYGIAKTFAFVSGASFGFTLLLLFIGLGFHEVIDLYPELLQFLAIAGAGFILYMGMLIISSNPQANIKKQQHLNFKQGVLLQWLNPKAWISCVSGVALFSEPNSHQLFLTFVTIYFLVCYLSLFFWSVLGDKVSLIVNNTLRLKVFNQLMGGLLIVTATYLLYSQCVLAL